MYAQTNCLASISITRKVDDQNRKQHCLEASTYVWRVALLGPGCHFNQSFVHMCVSPLWKDTFLQGLEPQAQEFYIP